MNNDLKHMPCNYEIGTAKASNKFCWSIEQETDADKAAFIARLQNCEDCNLHQQLDGMNIFAYRIDESDCIAYVNKSWETFAENNNGLPSCGFESLQGQSVWNQFADDESRMIYQRIFEKARSSKHIIQFQIHCDSLEYIRILKTSVIPLPQNWLELRFEMVSETQRNTEAIMAISPDSRGIITMCSYCGKLKNAQNQWDVIEEAITDQDLFKHSILPQISHGICPVCKDDFLKSLHKIIAEKK